MRNDIISATTNNAVNSITDASFENTATEPFANTPEIAPPDRSAIPSDQIFVSTPKNDGAYTSRQNIMCVRLPNSIGNNNAHDVRSCTGRPW